MQVYAPISEQPALGRALDDLREEEKPIYEFFTNAEYLDKFLTLLALEEQKGKDKFNPKHFIFFKVQPCVKVTEVPNINHSNKSLWGYK